MRKQKTLLFAGGLIVLSSAPHVIADDFNTSFQLRTDANIQGCTFDRTRATPKRTHGQTLEGRFAINCDSDRGYRIVTHLSPLAKIRTEAGSEYNVKLYLRKNAPACIEGAKHPDAIDFHSGARNVEIDITRGVTDWNYCLQSRRVGERLTFSDPWPVQGQLDIDLIDPDRGHWLPQSASMISLPFPNNVSTLSPDMEQLLDAVLTNIGGPNNVNIQIHAHASEVGDAAYNHDLSIMRLKHVREWLHEQGAVPRTSIWGQAWGESRPYAIKTVEDEEAQNRRVDVVFYPLNGTAVNDTAVQLEASDLEQSINSTEYDKEVVPQESIEVNAHEPVPQFEEELSDPVG